MALVVGTTQAFGPGRKYIGVSGVADDSVILQTDVVAHYSAFILLSRLGVFDVVVSLNGTDYATAPLSMVDMGSTASTPVIVSVAGRVYGFRGIFSNIKVLQNGAVNVVDFCMTAGSLAG